MLDAQHAVVASLAQEGDKFAPPQLAVTVAQGNVVPRAVLDAVGRFGFEQGVDLAVARVDAGVFGVDVIYKIGRIKVYILAG